MSGDKDRISVQSPGFTGMQASSNDTDERARGGDTDALGAVLEQVQAALDGGDMERARRLVGVAKELRALGFGG